MWLLASQTGRQRRLPPTAKTTLGLLWGLQGYIHYIPMEEEIVGLGQCRRQQKHQVTALTSQAGWRAAVGADQQQRLAGLDISLAAPTPRTVMVVA